MLIGHSRRDFLAGLSAASAPSILRTRGTLAGESLPETTTIRLKQSPAICFAPAYVAEAFLRTEGFTDISYVDAGLGIPPGEMLARGELDFDVTFTGTVVYLLDLGKAVTAVGGLHTGCYELFAHEPIRTVSDLKGRQVGVHALRSSGHLYLSIMAAHVGLDPHNDIDWITSTDGNALDRFAAGESDAFIGFPPEPQELRARGANRVILDTTTDKPWSQYICCMIYGNRAWVRDHPAATKRFLRAVYKAADYCQAEPENAARQLVDGGFAERYDYALQTIEKVQYDLWHEYDAEDTMRFFALRLHEVGMIKSSPNKLLAEGTDWRFLNELKRELKA
ncbi:MAG: ABC-type nitrate/sulfonate/bicarbonate transport system [Geminicoccaceae bacterium]|nr:ABC-type nitrate/sulfonate/bicarbonate transport system [Geminicoccaceae bacterium]